MRKHGIRGSRNPLILVVMHEANFHTTKLVLDSSIDKYLVK